MTPDATRAGLASPTPEQLDVGEVLDLIARESLAARAVDHWHFALGHHNYKSPLAERVFQQLPPQRLDPTRDRAQPVRHVGD